MEQSEARDILHKLRTELNEAHGVVEAAGRRVAALEKLVEGYVELFPDLATATVATVPSVRYSPNGADRPRGQDAIVKVMESIEYKGRYWTLSTMMEELTKLGWLPESDNPANAIRTSLDRVAEREPCVHKGRGSTGTVVWYWQGEGYPPPRFAIDAGRGVNTHNLGEANTT